MNYSATNRMALLSLKIIIVEASLCRLCYRFRGTTPIAYHRHGHCNCNQYQTARRNEIVQFVLCTPQVVATGSRVEVHYNNNSLRVVCSDTLSEGMQCACHHTVPSSRMSVGVWWTISVSEP